MMDRRTFLKYGMAIGGGLCLPSMGLALPHKRKLLLGGGGLSTDTFGTWASWDETSESGWGDSTNTFICFDEGGLAADETGSGVVSGSNRTFTQAGGIPAYSGSPPSRLLSGGAASKFFIPTTTLLDAFFNTSSTYTFITKIKIIDGIRDYYAFTLSGVPTGWIGFYPMSTNVSRFYLIDLDSSDTIELGNSTPLNQIVYVFIYSNGTKTRCGVTTTRPTSWAAIAAGDKGEATALKDRFATFNGTSYIQAANTAGIYFYYTLISKLCLIGD